MPCPGGERQRTLAPLAARVNQRSANVEVVCMCVCVCVYVCQCVFPALSGAGRWRGRMVHGQVCVVCGFMSWMVSLYNIVHQNIVI